MLYLTLFKSDIKYSILRIKVRNHMYILIFIVIIRPNWSINSARESFKKRIHTSIIN